MGGSSPERRAVRPGALIAFCIVGVAVIWFFLGLIAAFFPSPANVLAEVVLGVAGLWSLVRSLRMGVLLSDDAVVVRNFARTLRAAASEIAAFDVRPSAGWTGPGSGPDTMYLCLRDGTIFPVQASRSMWARDTLVPQVRAWATTHHVRTEGSWEFSRLRPPLTLFLHRVVRGRRGR